VIELPPWANVLVLVIVANSAPWMASRWLSRRWSAPVDGGSVLADGTRVLGDHKTWRGITAAMLACGLVALLLGYSLLLGAAFGLLALLADAASSFVKRRLRLNPGTEVPGLDQLPEALVPALVLSKHLHIGLAEVVAISVTFLVLNLAVVRLRLRRD